MNVFLSVVISLLFSFFPLLKVENEKTFVGFIKKNRMHIAFFVVLFIGCFIRLIMIDKFPVGLNQDEASSGYEAFSVLNYGIDRNGMSYPVHFISWGSGQNVLYSYLIMFFINVISNYTLSIRLPMALIGCLTMTICYKFIKDNCYSKYGLLALFIVAVIPWHIMKSRWGLESNLFPDLFLYGLFFLYYGLTKESKLYYILASIIFGISVYSYGTSYMYIPIFLLMIYIYLVIIKRLTYKKAIVYFMISGLVALPMVIFVIINYFELNTVKLLGITIPRLDYNRFTSITSVNGNFLYNCFINLKSTFEIVLFQEDDLVLNYISKFGCLYPISIPFIVYGFIVSIKSIKSNVLYFLNFFSFITSVLVSMMVIPNINRINSIWFSLIIYLIIGLINICQKSNLFYKVIVFTYLCFFVLFVRNYFTVYQDTIRYPKSLDSAIKYAEQFEYKNLYIDHDVGYIYYLLYNKVNPNYYLSNREIKEKNVMFQKVLSIGNVYFNSPKELTTGNVYIVRKNYNVGENSCNEKVYTDFKVIYCNGK